MSEQLSDSSDEALGRRLAADLPRYSAPARLRAALERTVPGRPARLPWLAPAFGAVAAALVVALVLLPRIAPTDPARRLTRVVVGEHERAVMLGARHVELIPGALPKLREASGIDLPTFFAGDDQLRFVGAEPVLLERHRGLVLYYRDPEGHLVTYAVLRAPGLALPERARVMIDRRGKRFRPALLHDDGFASWVWKQGDLACFLVTSMAAEPEVEKLKDYFVRIRTATEPVPAK